MKKLLFIAILLGLVSIETKASHILGGEVTYTHIENKKYQVLLTVYRDCNECLLDGAGGGNSTKNCNKPSLEMRVASGTSCTGADIGLIPITRTKIDKILPVCEGIKTKCEDNSNYEFGVEAHYYTAIIDFANYKKYQSCGFELFLRATDRSTEITNVSVGKTAKFYNFAYINPWVDHNSPQLSKNPNLLLTCQKAYTHNLLASNETDSIAISSEAPMEGKSTYSTYNFGYSKNKPMTVICDPGCPSNRRTVLPRGFYLDNKGNVAFTPTACNDVALLVFQIEKWRKIDGKYTKLSTVRRDIQLTVLPGLNNTPVFADTTEEVFACIGSELCIDINAYDAQAFTSGSPLPPDTVNYIWETNIPNAKIKQVAINQAPFYKLNLCWTPKKEEYQNKPYYLKVKLRDNACPLNAEASKVIEFYTRKIPHIAPEANLLNCGFIGVNSHLKKESFTTEQWLLRDQNQNLVSSSSSGIDSLKSSRAGTFNLEYLARDKYGCEASYSEPIVLTDKFVNPVLIHPIIPVDVCDEEEFKVELIPNNREDQLQAKWSFKGTLISEEVNLITEAKYEMNNNPIDVKVTRIKDGLACRSNAKLIVRVKALPEIELWDSQSLCYKGEYLDINNAAKPAGGSWFNKENLIDFNGKFATDKTPITEDGGEYILNYSIIDQSTGCKGSKDAKIIINPLPKVEIEDITVCRHTGKFYLETALNDQNKENTYKWISKDGKLNIIDNEFFVLDNLNSGGYNLKCEVTTPAGCFNSKEFTLTILETAKISFLDIKSICKQEKAIDLSELLDVSPKGGTWYNNDLQEEIQNGLIPQDYCGTINLNYTYNLGGCFDSKNTDIEIICRPKITISTPDKICKNIESFVPEANPKGGNWTGAAFQNGKIITPENTDQFTLTYEYSHNGCKYEESKEITLTDAPFAHISDVPEAICEGETLNFGEVKSNNKTWRIEHLNNNVLGNSITPSENEIENCVTKFSIRATGEGMCNLFIENYQVTINPSPEIVLEDELAGCEPFEMSFKPVFKNPKINADDVQAQWVFNDPNSNKNQSSNLNPRHTYEQAGTYNLDMLFQTNQGCKFEHTANNFIKVHPKPVAQFSSIPDDAMSIHEPIVQFYNHSTCVDEMDYIWDFGTNKSDNISYKKNPAFEFPKDTGAYIITLTAISENHCFSQFSKEIYMNPDIRLFIPTAFSPNKKGPAETEVFKMAGVNVQDFSITIWNRWGQIVYQSQNINEVWDGKYGGKYCQPGVFGYKIQATSTSNQDYDFSGIINLLR